MKIQIDKNAKVPLYQQIAEQIKEDVKQGKLSPGDKLPSVRRLTAMAGVSHVTAVKAYDQLAREGLVHQKQGRGTFVSRLPSMNMYNIEPPSVIADQETRFEWQRKVRPQASAAKFRSQLAGGSGENSIAFTVSYPDPQLWPLDAFRRILKGLSNNPEPAFQMAPPLGESGLREAIVPYLEFHGIQCDASDVMITSGTQQGLDLVVRTLVEQGEWVACEDPTYAVMLDVLGSTSTKILPIPVDEDGMQVDILAERMRERKVRVIYTIPTFHNPTGVVMSDARRRNLLELAEEHNAIILEDDPYRDLYFEKKPPRPIKSMDVNGRVIYLSGLTKLLCPGLRLGVVVTSGYFNEYLMDAKIVADLFTNTTTQYIARELLTQFDWRRHFAINRETLRDRRDLLAVLLAEHLPGVRFNTPPGGMNVWLALPRGFNDRSLQDACIKEGVQIAPGHVFFAERNENSYVRLSFSGLNEDEIRTGVERMASVWQVLRARGSHQNDGDRMPFV